MGFLILMLAFVLVPIAEIALLIDIGSQIGLRKTLLIVIFTAVLGAYLVRQQGFATLAAVRRETEAGRLPALQMAEGLLLLVAGAVLLTPGFITDALGFALLTPPLRRALIRWIASKGLIQATSGPVSPGTKQGPSVLEGEFTERK
ncbi:MAG: FxsA family protein [Gammaproteobacteria bacterium]|nr:FxsA family protein [Gammaproteobacteria bacterium]